MYCTRTAVFKVSQAVSRRVLLSLVGGQILVLSFQILVAHLRSKVRTIRTALRARINKGSIQRPCSKVPILVSLTRAAPIVAAKQVEHCPVSCCNHVSISLFSRVFLEQKTRLLNGSLTENLGRNGREAMEAFISGQDKDSRKRFVRLSSYDKGEEMRLVTPKAIIAQPKRLASP